MGNTKTGAEKVWENRDSENDTKQQQVRQRRGHGNKSIASGNGPVALRRRCFSTSQLLISTTSSLLAQVASPCDCAWLTFATTSQASVLPP